MTHIQQSLRGLTALAMLMAASAASQALDISCSPGQLHSLVGEAAAVTTLTLSGSVDASDLYFIGDRMTSLTHLDMAAVTITAYSGAALHNAMNYPAATIPAHAFAGSALTSVVLPQATTTLADGAFAGSRLASVTLTPAVRATGTGVFADCPGLRQADLAGAVLGPYAFMQCQALESVNLAGTTVLPEGAFRGCASLAAVGGAPSLSSIGAKAFEGCRSLASIDLGPALTSMGARAFAQSGLTEIDLSGCTALAALPDWAFEGCTALYSAILPTAMDAVGQGAFFDCTSLRSVNFPATDIADFTLKGAPLDGAPLMLAEGTESIGRYALKDSRIADITLPSSLERLGDGAMEGTTSLTHINAPELDHAPALGTDVWKGVVQQRVTLHVSPDAAPLFLATPQWQEFRITATSTQVPTAQTARTLRGRFAGAVLQLRSAGPEIAAVALYDTAGTMLLRAAVDAADADIDTSAMATNIFIVAVELTDGSRAVLKMLR